MRYQRADLKGLLTSYIPVTIPQPLAVPLHNAVPHTIPMTATLAEHPARFGLALDDERVQAYSERAFQYFLGSERQRCVRSGGQCLLVLVELKGRDGAAGRIPPTVAEKLFGALWQSVRETDFFGWYREQRVAGAVLTEVAGNAQGEALRRVIDRIRCAFEDQLPVDISSRLDIRVSDGREDEVLS
jgi:hypothetical protein